VIVPLLGTLAKSIEKLIKFFEKEVAVTILKRLLNLDIVFFVGLGSETNLSGSRLQYFVLLVPSFVVIIFLNRLYVRFFTQLSHI
jgi:hypothetical protein